MRPDQQHRELLANGLGAWRSQGACTAQFTNAIRSGSLTDPAQT
ncbi:MAG: hypothetical protein A4E45_01402 [Methanosaeta sp. PtaB.Bin039]|nr:MAG: hypothetical protein A4E45_01402 [Methanosaeta sp. PtaB.Bin039]